MDVQESIALPPEYAGLTFEKVWAAIQETSRQMKETDKKIQEVIQKV
ncbi:MAG: hypothetical protein LBP80_05180 [Treponema sp.]|jgi:hypothetical protein|nr:hypothetical protein [Treponema sp.]